MLLEAGAGALTAQLVGTQQQESSCCPVLSLLLPVPGGMQNLQHPLGRPGIRGPVMLDPRSWLFQGMKHSHHGLEMARLTPGLLPNAPEGCGAPAPLPISEGFAVSFSPGVPPFIVTTGILRLHSPPVILPLSLLSTFSIRENNHADFKVPVSRGLGFPVLEAFIAAL